MNNVNEEQPALICINPNMASLKRLAWMYGCSKKGSDEEKQLLAVLVARIQGGT